jgi:uroporphyrin-3 C-methyltransferase
MSETDDPAMATPPATTPVNAPAPAPKRGNGGTVIAAIILIAIAAAGYFAWQSWNAAQGRQQADQTDRQQLALRVESAARSAEQAHRDTDTLRARLDDAAKVNQSLREQLLGLTVRARLVEDALTNLADKRLSGHDAMLLSESEMLLALGAERYTLFHDTTASIEAYRLADTALAAIDDAAFSTVRQSISAEIDAFVALRSADTSATLRELAQLRVAVAQLPAAARGLDHAGDDAGEPRWQRLLAQFVRVHRSDDTAEVAARHGVGLARQLLALDLRDAEAALLARDELRFRAALTDAQALLRVDFDGKDDATKAVRATLDALAKLELAPPAPTLLGTALKELRNLRATHALRQSAAPAQVAKPAEGQQ